MIDPLHRAQVGFLQNIVGIDTPMQPMVHAKRDHPAQAIAIMRKQLRQRLLIAAHDAIDKIA